MSNKFKKQLKFKYSMTIRKQLLIVYFLLIIIPMGFFTYLAYYRVSNVVYNQTLTSASQSFKESVTNLERYLTDMNTIMINLLESPEIYDVANQDPDNFLQDKNKVKTIRNFMNYLKNTTGVSNISFYSENVYSTNPTRPTSSIRDLYQEKWYTQLVKSKTRRLWFSSYLTSQQQGENAIISYASRIFQPEQLDNELAVIKIDLNKDVVLEVLNRTAFTPNSITYIYDGKDIILSNLVEPNKLDFDEINIAINNDVESQWLEGNIGDKKVSYIAHKNLLTGWYIVSIIPMKDITSTGNQLGIEMLAAMIIISIISYVMAYFISSSSVKRLSTLTNEMKKVENGNISVAKLQTSGEDEISVLIRGFNSMVSKLSTLIEEKYQIGLEVKNFELKALQSQINPHFLYNSLDMINCLSIKYDIKEIGQMVNALSKFYKLSLSYGYDVIPIKDELAHVTCYIDIQNLRYENSVTLIKEVDQELYSYKMVKIILQPIVENAIIHGIFGKDSKTGTIRITGKCQEQIIILTVEDDGIGMSQEMAQTLLCQDLAKDKHGYGVYNTHTRLSMYYGSDYGLSYESRLGIGTIVTVRIPAME